MNKWLWVILAVLGCAPIAHATDLAAARAKAESSTLVKGTVEMDANGQLTGLTLDERAKIEPAVVAIIERQSKSWRFEPVIVDGQARPARAPMTLRLIAKKVGDDHVNLRIGSASFGGNDERPGYTIERQSMASPEYPSQAVVHGVTGTVYVVLRVGRDGRVTDAIAEQTNLGVVGSDAEMAQFRKLLEKSSLRAARRWRFKTPTAGDSATDSFWNVRVPIAYQFFGQDHQGDGEWETYIPGPRSSVPWVRADDLLVGGTDAVGDGDLYQIGTGVRLLTPLDQG